VDGKSVGEVNYNGKFGDFSFAKIGRQGTEMWSGVIDEVAVFNQALAQEDIKAIMEGLEKAFAVSPASKLTTSWGISNPIENNENLTFERRCIILSKRCQHAAIIGLGGQGRAHNAAYAGLPNVKLVAICEINPERLSAFINENPDVRGYTDANALFKNEDIDILSIVTNTPSHSYLTIAAVEAGVRAVLCEKPMAHSLEAAKQMIDTCATHGVRLAINHMRRWSTRYNKLCEMLQNGLIGEIGNLIYISGGALFACIATHIFDLMRMLTRREIISVSAGFDAFRRPNPRGEQYYDPGGHALALFEGDTRAFIDLSENLGVPGWFDIHGSLGRIHIEEERGIWQIMVRQGTDREQPPWAARNTLQPIEFPDGGEDWTSVLRAGIVELLGDGKVTSSGEDGYAALEAIVAAHISHENGGVPVALPLTGDALLREFTFT